MAQGAQNKGAEESEGKHRCCLGALYFSQALNEKGKRPVCAGVRQTINTAQDLSSHQSEALPPGYFKYVCVGYSMYNETRLKKQQETGQVEQGVQVPYCEGLEVISVPAPALQTKPVLLQEGAEGLDANSGSNQPGNVQPRPPRHFVPDPASGILLNEFPERFMRVSRKIVDRMGTNATHVVSTTKRYLDRVHQEGWGRSKDV